MTKWAVLILPILLAPTAGSSAPKQPWRYAKKLASYHAECIFSRRSKSVKDWLALLSGSKTEQRRFNQLQVDFPVCFNSAQEEGWSYTFESAAVRESLIRYLIVANWQKIPPLPPAKLETGNWYSADQLAESGASEAATAYSVGRCLARGDWRNSRSLSGAELGSQEEKDALAKLVVLLPQCVPSNVTLRIHKARLRAIIEETVYHASVEVIDA